MLIRILSMLIFVSALLNCIDAACLSSINNKFKLNFFKFDSDLLYVKIFSLTFFIATFYLNWLINIFSVKVFWSVDCLHPVIFMLLQNVCPNKCIDIWIINSVWSNRKVLMLFLQKITTFIAMRYSSCGIYAASFIRWREFIWSAQCL